MTAQAENINVSTRAQLIDALASAQAGDEIVLAAGDYGSFDFNGYNYSGYVTVRSADPDNPAVFDQIDIVNSSYLVIDSVHVDNPSNGVASSKVVNIDGNSHDIVFSNSEVNGSVTSSTDYNEFQGHYGVYTGGNVRDIRVEGNYVHDVKNGFVALGSDDIEVVGNRFDRLGNDTMKFAGVTGVLIENNIGPSSNFQAPTAHVDFIQFQGSSEDIVIRGNVYLAGNIGSTQAIFMADGSYNNVLIEQNILYTGMLHGITVYSGANVTIRDNTVLNAPDLVHKATIIQSPDGATVTGNIISTTGYGGKVSGGNLYVQHDRPDQAHHYGDYFENAEAGLGITLDDLVPLAGSLAEQYGAYERLMELLNGETWEPDPVPQPDPDPGEPTPDEPTGGETPPPDEATQDDLAADEPEAGGNEPEIGTVTGAAFSLLGVANIANASDVIELAHSDEFALGSATVAMTYTLDSSSGLQGLFSKDASHFEGGGNHLSAYVRSGVLTVRFQDGESSQDVSVQGIESGRAYDLQISFDGTDALVWLDGQVVGSVKTSMTWSGNQEFIQIGGLGWGSSTGQSGFGSATSGSIEDVLIVAGVWSPDQTAQILADKAIPEAPETPTEGETPPDPAAGPNLDDAALQLLDPMQFSSQADVFEFAPSDALNVESGTIALRFETEDTSGLEGILTRDAKSLGGDGNHLAVYLQNSTLKVRFQDGETTETVSISGIRAGQTYDLHITFDGTQAQVWLDDVLVETVDTGMSWENSPEFLQIGAMGWASSSGAPGSTNSFDGTIEDLVILDGVWSTDSVAQMIAEADAWG